VIDRVFNQTPDKELVLFGATASSFLLARTCQVLAAARRHAPA
jgi:hypothetical protein